MTTITTVSDVLSPSAVITTKRRQTDFDYLVSGQTIYKVSLKNGEEDSRLTGHKDMLNEGAVERVINRNLFIYDLHPITIRHYLMRTLVSLLNIKDISFIHIS